MRLTLIFSLALFSFKLSAQTVVPFVDFNNFFKTYQNGFFRQLEFQQIKDFKFGDNVVAYIDMRENLRVFDGDQPMNVANLMAEYEVSDNLMTWKIGPTLNLWDAGKLKTLTYFANRYTVMDSIVVYEDTRFNTMNVYYKGKTHQLFAGFGELEWPVHIGHNILVFKDNGSFYKIFWRGQIYDIDSWNNPIKFAGETDIICFNDPINGTFAIFENGQLYDLEQFHVPNYKAGNGSVMYTDLNGNLKIYKKGKVETVSNFSPDFYAAVDSMMVWGENNALYVFWEGKKKELVRYIPEEYQMKNNTLVFKNLMGGVTCFNKDGLKDISNQMDATYTIHGNGVLVQLFNRSYIYYTDGRLYYN